MHVITHTWYASKYAHTQTCAITHAMFSCSTCTCILIASSIDAESRIYSIAMDMLDGVEPDLGESMESLGSEQ